MVGKSGIALRSCSTALYAIECGCAIIVLGIYSYYLARLTSNNLPISRDWKAVEGLSGSIVLYTIFAVLLTCFLGGKKFFAILAIVLDVLMTVAFVALAILTRGGASSCKGATVTTPLGNGPSNDQSPAYGDNNFGFAKNVNTNGYSPNLGLACRLNTAAFAVAVIGAFLMLLSAVLQVAVGRNHQKEKSYGPSTANNYTSGSGRSMKFWKRSPKSTDTTRDAEMAVPASTSLTPGHAAPLRPSHDTQTTDGYKSAEGAPYSAPVQPAPVVTNSTGGYHRAPTGTAVNPYSS